MKLIFLMLFLILMQASCKILLTDDRWESGTSHLVNFECIYHSSVDHIETMWGTHFTYTCYSANYFPVLGKNCNKIVLPHFKHARSEEELSTPIKRVSKAKANHATISDPKSR